MKSRVTTQVEAAMQMVAGEEASDVEKAEMLMEIAMGLQQKPKHREDILAAVKLYEESIGICPGEAPLLLARIKSRLGNALLGVPTGGSDYLERGKEVLEEAIEIFEADPSTLDQELAEAEMNLGLVLHNLSGFHKVKIADAISAYQRSLRVFDKHAYPQEYAILQNNLATAFLSVSYSGKKKLGETLAVQAFEQGLSVVDIIDHPSEYAMLQNNLGNALQYASSAYRVENGLRALQAYDEALKVRNPKDTPAEYANTIANKANCLSNLPDHPDHPERGSLSNLRKAKDLYSEAKSIFHLLEDHNKVGIVEEALQSIDSIIEKSNCIKQKEM